MAELIQLERLQKYGSHAGREHWVLGPEAKRLVLYL